MADMVKFLCSTEYCLEQIKSGLIHSLDELYEMIGRSAATSIQRMVRHTFFSENCYIDDGKVKIFFYDEIDPEKITEYLIETNSYSSDPVYIFELICRIQQKEVNAFYKELDDYNKEPFVRIKIAKKSVLEEKNLFKDYERLYRISFEKRATQPYKRIRAK